MNGLFDDLPRSPTQERISDGAVLLRAFVDAPAAASLMEQVEVLLEQSPLRHMNTPGGRRMSAAMSSCGQFGWITDSSGYRYVAVDPLTGEPWPAMPADLRELAQRAASAAGFDDFEPDACLINRYAPGAKMSLHQDKDERDLRQPVVSLSLGLPGIFAFGGAQRSDPVQRMLLESGDMVVWGGPARLLFHGIDKVPEGEHRLTGNYRFNLTFRAVR